MQHNAKFLQKFLDPIPDPDNDGDDDPTLTCARKLAVEPA